MRRPVESQLVLKQSEQVGVLQLQGLGGPRAGLRIPCGGCFLDLHLAVPGLEAQERPGAKEAVTSQPLAAHHALEQERPVSLLDLAKRAYRGQRIADQLTIDRHQAGAIGQRDKFMKGRKIAHPISKRVSLYYNRETGLWLRQFAGGGLARGAPCADPPPAAPG